MISIASSADSEPAALHYLGVHAEFHMTIKVPQLV